mgnify:CR=1 FL=1
MSSAIKLTCDFLPAAKLNLIGDFIQGLKVVEYAGRDDYGCHYWVCECKCGNTHTVKGSKLLSNESMSPCNEL